MGLVAGAHQKPYTSAGVSKHKHNKMATNEFSEYKKVPWLKKSGYEYTIIKRWIEDYIHNINAKMAQACFRCLWNEMSIIYYPELPTAPSTLF